VNRRKKNFYTIASIFLLIFIPGISLVDAGPASIEIRSQYRNPSTQQWYQETNWNFRLQDDLQYAVFRNDEKKPTMLLTYSNTGRLVRIDDFLTGMENRNVGKNTITLSWGFPIPFDDLRPGSSGKHVETIHKQVGDTRFAYQIIKETRLISFDDAVAQGMLSRRQKTVYPGTLKLITIWHDQNVLVRQLWAEGAGWWLYEDTDTRRSWREP
jgi:hypothetical protein